ncbi:50S ribosomal protein L15 [archaeon]|nr:50S ribosomal protein L15 [archaeon]
MTISKRRKVTKYRGSKTHGGGAMKKRRGAGNRGGRGMAGSGKRADQKKPTILKEYGNKYFGKHGFKRPQKKLKKLKTINVGLLEIKLDYFVKKELVKKEGDNYIINLKLLGYDKLLGAGDIKNKYVINNALISKKAREKIENLGGKINES